MVRNGDDGRLWHSMQQTWGGGSARHPLREAAAKSQWVMGMEATGQPFTLSHIVGMAGKAWPSVAILSVRGSETAV